MNTPFLYLFACSAKNRVLARVRRLREPRYLIGAIVGSAYLYFFLIRNRFRAGHRPTGSVFSASSVLPLELVGTLGLWFVVLLRWFIPVSRQPLELSGAERDLLLTAPIPRRRIVRYKLLRSQVAIFLSSALILVFAWTSVGNAWSFLFGMFLVFATLRLHLLGAALGGQLLRGGGGRRDPAIWIAVGVMACATIAAFAVVVPAATHLLRTQRWEGTFALARAQASAPFTSVALLPFALLVRPALADWPRGFLVAAVPAVALVLVNYLWVLHGDDLLQESAQADEREVVRGTRSAPRPKFRRPPFVLAPSGAPEWAVVWKNLIMLGRYVTPLTLLRLGIPLVMLAVIAGTSHRAALATGLSPIVIGVTCFLAVIGPYSFRNDLRQDLAHLSVLKTWPVSGERLLWGEVLAPWFVLTSIVGLLIVLTGLLSIAVPAATLAWKDRLAIGLAAVLVLPAIALAQLVVQNATVVLFPGWAAVGPSRPRGVEAMGQQMLMFAATLLLLAVGLLPGAAIAVAIGVLTFPWVGWLSLLPGAVVLAVLLAAECALAVHALGRVLDRTDPVAVDA